MKTKSEYLRAVNGRKIDTDGVPKQPYQCADLIKDYLRVVFNVKNFSFTLPTKNPYGYAKSLWENFNDYPQLKDRFVKIKNTANFVPALGDIVVWGPYKGVTGEAGHVAIATGKNNGTATFVSMDQNWSNKYYCTEVTHNYRGVYGVIRPLQKVTTADLNVRTGPGITYKKADEEGIKKGELVRPLTYKNNFAKIDENRWVSAKYLE